MDKGLKTPLEFLVEKMLDETNPMMLRVDCAKAAAPYIHRRQPQAIDGGEGKPITTLNLGKLSELPDDQLDQFIQIATKLADDGGADGREEPEAEDADSVDVPRHGESAT